MEIRGLQTQMDRSKKGMIFFKVSSQMMFHALIICIPKNLKHCTSFFLRQRAKYSKLPTSIRTYLFILSETKGDCNKGH